MLHLIALLFLAICNANSIEEILIKDVAKARLPVAEKCNQQFQEYLNNLENFDTDFWAWQSKYLKMTLV